MAKQSRGRRALAQLLQNAVQPIYLLDDKSRIVFANDALCRWVGHRDDELLGIPCPYHSIPVAESVGDADDALSHQLGLAPPPSQSADRAESGVVWCWRDHELLTSDAMFQPLTLDDEDVPMLLAVLATGNFSSTSHNDDRLIGAGHDYWHGRLVEFGREIGNSSAAPWLVGDSSCMKRVRRLAKLAIESRANVVVYAPTGGGAVSVAEHIVRQRCQSPKERFLRLDAPALNEELLRATVLTFWQRGQELETHDTLLLTEVDQFDIACQATLRQLLTVEQLELDIVAASRAKLDENSSFDPVLADHWRCIEIELPPLASRLADLPLVSQAIIEAANRQGPRQVQGVAEETLNLLMGYRWRRDVDELTEILVEAHRKAAEFEIQPCDLPESVQFALDAERYPADAKPASIDMDELLQEIEIELIRRALAEARGNRAAAARALGINRSRLLRRIELLGIQDAESNAGGGKQSPGEPE